MEKNKEKKAKAAVHNSLTWDVKYITDRSTNRIMVPPGLWLAQKITICKAHATVAQLNSSADVCKPQS